MNFNPYYSNYLQNLSSERSFNYRKSVNILSLVIILATYLNTVPSEIAALGISLEGTEQKQLVAILLFVDAYLFLAFSFRTYIDYQRHKSILLEKAFSHIIEMDNWLIPEIKKHDKVVNTETKLKSQRKEMDKFIEMTRDKEGVEKYIAEYGFQLGDKKFDNLKEMNKYLRNITDKRLELNDQIDRYNEKAERILETLDSYKMFKDKPIIKNAENYGKLYWSFYVLVPVIALILSTLSVYFY